MIEVSSSAYSKTLLILLQGMLITSGAHQGVQGCRVSTDTLRKMVQTNLKINIQKIEKRLLFKRVL